MKDLSEQSYYEVLELAPGCAADALLKAYALARERYGPGALATYALAEPGESEALLRRVEEAFAVLSDPERRQAYDTAGGFVSVVFERAPAEPELERAPQREPEPVPEVTAIAEAALVEAAVAAPPEPPSQEPAPAVAHEPPSLEAEPKIEAAPEPKAEPEHKPVRKTESELPADAVVTGEALRRVREARGLSLKDVEGRTKIGHWHLENIERERYADLPAQVYLRGFLMAFARELKLDPVRVARSYLEQMKTKPQAKTE